MPKVNHVEKARRDQGACSNCGRAIKAGDAYRWWKFKQGSRFVRCDRRECAPKASDLTRSETRAAALRVTEELSEWLSTARSNDEIEPAIEAAQTAATQLREIADALREKVTNMEQYFPNGSSVMAEMSSQAESLDYTAGELEAVAEDIKARWDSEQVHEDDVPDNPEFEKPESGDYEDREEYAEAVAEAIREFAEERNADLVGELIDEIEAVEVEI